jgi:hypothetical protein
VAAPQPGGVEKPVRSTERNHARHGLVTVAHKCRYRAADRPLGARHHGRVNDDSDPGGEDPKAPSVDRSMPKDGVA